MDNYIVYIKLDENSSIVKINSSAFLVDASGWMQIDEGIGDKYHHAQSQYFEKGLVDENGCCNYKLVDGVVTERTDEEKQAEVAARPPAPPTAEERLALAEDTINFLLGL